MPKIYDIITGVFKYIYNVIIIFNNSKFDQKNKRLCSRKVRTYISKIKFKGNKLNTSYKTKSIFE